VHKRFSRLTLVLVRAESPMCIAGKDGSALGRNVCACRLAIFRQKATHGGFNVRVERKEDERGKEGETVDTYETLHRSAEKPISYAFRRQIISPFYGLLKYKSSSKLNSSPLTLTWRTITSIL